MPREKKRRGGMKRGGKERSRGGEVEWKRYLRRRDEEGRRGGEARSRGGRGGEKEKKG